MTDRFVGVHHKVNRAKHHTDDLERQIKAFWDSKPYEIGTEGNPKTGPGSYRIKGIPKPLPDAVVDTAGDACHNLRAAFDHLAYAAVPRPHNHAVAFPVWRKPRTPNRRDWEGSVNGQLKGAKGNFMHAVKALEVYQGGATEWLWSIDNLDIVDKHRLLLAVASANTGIVLDAAAHLRAAFPEQDSAIFPSLEYVLCSGDGTPVKPGTELFTVMAADGFPYDAEPKFTFDITLGEPEVLKGQPIMPTLRQLIDDSERLIQSLISLA